MPTIDARGLSKIYPGSADDPQGTWIASYGVALWIRNIVRRIGLVSERTPPVKALDAVSLRVEQGEVLGLLGPNGAGKTTLIKILAGLLAPSGGDARVAGYDVNRQRAMVRRSVSYVSTTGWMGLEWPLSVRESLRLYGGLSGLSGRRLSVRIDEAMERTGLAADQHKVIQQLSHGMRQKLVLARGLLVATPVLFLDEPTVGLDPTAAQEVRRVIRDSLAAGRGQTVVVTTHDIAEADAICSRIGIMHEGRIIAVGTPSELREHVRDRLVAHCRASNLTERVTVEISTCGGVIGATGVIQEPANGRGLLRIHMNRDHDVTPEVLDRLRTLGVRVNAFGVREPDLEDVFLHLTGGGLR